MTENFNKNHSRYYDLLYKDKDYKAESDYVINWIRLQNPLAKNIIELGCGTGNHATILCEKGFLVTGLERSADMVALAKRKAIKGFTSVVSDITAFDIPEEFDAAISLFHVVSYLTHNHELVSCFIAVNKHLKQNAIFIFDVWYSPAVYFQKPETRIKTWEDGTLKITRIAEPEIHYNENVVDVNYEINFENKSSKTTEVHNEKHRMRHFSIPEIELVATFTGFKVIKCEEFLSGKRPGNDTWGVCFVLQKI